MAGMQKLTGKATMRRSQRLIAASVLMALSGVLAGCSSGLGNFDPSDLLDFLDTKKKLPGERKPVFPDGVPGLEQGVPKDLYKGAQQQDQQNADAAAAPVAAAPPPAEEPKARRTARSKSAANQPAAANSGQPAPEAAPEEDATAAAPPPPKPKKIVRRRTTAPPPDQSDQSAGDPAQSAQQSPSPFPAPMPSGTYSR
jgi:hypothetical protein